MRTRWAALVGVLLALFAVAGPASIASATDPVTLDSGFVTDENDSLTDAEESAAEARLSELSEKTGTDLFVVYVDETTNPTDTKSWADLTAINGQLGTDQLLLAIATTQNTYGLSYDQETSISDSTLDAIEEAIGTPLHDRDWAAVVDAAAGAIEGPDLSWVPLVLLGIVILAALIALVLWLAARARRRKRGAQPEVPDPNDPFSTLSDDELATNAGSALVHADDAITSSKEELGFATAQFGDDATARFSQTVDAAAAKIAEAFALQQQLDDEVPDSAEQRRAWHIQIIQLCDAADDLLDENVQAFDELRTLEQQAPQALEAVTARRIETATALPSAVSALQALTASYDAAALATVTANPPQAQERLNFADSEISEAGTALAAGKNGEAAFAIRTAEEAVTQAAQLVSAVTNMGASLAQIEQQSRALIADLEADVAAAAQLPDPQGQLASVVASTQSHLSEATTNLESTSRDPQRILAMLTSANEQIDGAISQVRDAAVRAQRAQQVLAQTIAQAQAQISAANDFIATRRGAVGATARTRLAEATASLSQAISLSTTDPAQALTLASRASALAQEATTAAQSDVSGWNSTGYGVGSGSGFAGDVLGGILGGIIGSAARSGGGWGGGGSSWRSSGGSRGFRPSGFGGSGGGGRSGGGSSGGRRSRGGRF